MPVPFASALKRTAHRIADTQKRGGRVLRIRPGRESGVPGGG